MLLTNINALTMGQFIPSPTPRLLQELRKRGFFRIAALFSFACCPNACSLNFDRLRYARTGQPHMDFAGRENTQEFERCGKGERGRG